MPVVMAGKTLHYLKSSSMHSHNTWEIILNLKGYGEDIIGETRYPFSPGSIICIPPHTAHAKRSTRQFLDIFIQCTEFFVSKEPRVLTYHDENRWVASLMQLIHQMFHQDDGGHRDAMHSLADSMQYMLLSTSRQVFFKEPVNTLVQQMIENISNPEFRPAAAIARLPYCVDYARKLFRAETGMTPVAYLHMLRIRQARRLLRQQASTAHSVSEIAYMCGFYDPKYFARVFKQSTQMTPMAFAAMHAG